METEIELNGIKYVPVSEMEKRTTMAKSVKGKKYVIVRTFSAGVFAGYLGSRKGQEVVLLNVRRLWYWEGANSLSQMAVEGTSKPDKCKFPVEMPRVELLQAIEIIDVTEMARRNIAAVPVWTKN